MQRSLACVPMQVRRKLDRIGLKVGLEQWRALSAAERMAVGYLPADDAEECDAMAAFVREAVARRCGSEPRPLSAEQRAAAEPPPSPPAELVGRARSAGYALDRSAWSHLDADQRYALTKLGAGAVASHSLAAALEEFIGSSARPGYLRTK